MFRKISNIEVRNQPIFCLKEGIQKNARAIATEAGNSVEMMLQVDAKKTAFYVAGNLIDFVLEFNRWRENDLEDPSNWPIIQKQLRGLAVRTTHLENNRVFVITRVTRESARE